MTITISEPGVRYSGLNGITAETSLRLRRRYKNMFDFSRFTGTLMAIKNDTESDPAWLSENGLW